MMSLASVMLPGWYWQPPPAAGTHSETDDQAMNSAVEEKADSGQCTLALAFDCLSYGSTELQHQRQEPNNRQPQLDLAMMHSMLVDERLHILGITYSKRNMNRPGGSSHLLSRVRR